MTPGSRTRPRVLFVLPSLAGGGAERTVLNLLNHLDLERFTPTLVLFQLEGPYLSLLRDDIEVVVINRRTRSALFPLARQIRRLRPHLVFSTLLLSNVVAVAARLLSLHPAVSIVRESNHQTAAGRATTGLQGRAVGWAYRRAHRVVSLSVGVAADVRERYGLSSERTCVIYNPVDLQHVQTLSAEPLPAEVRYPYPGRFNVLAVGRFMPQKGFDLLIRAMASLRDTHWHLTILGEGREREALERLAAELSVASRVDFPGFQQNPYSWMARADLFVLSSRWEGFGHVIVEAMACGTPVLATRCPSGPAEIIEDRVDGRLCAITVEDLAERIAELADSPEDRRRYAEAGRVTVKRFDVQAIARQYEDLFLEAIARQPTARMDAGVC